MKFFSRTIACAAVAVVLVVACGGKPTTASKSAAAYREAQAKGKVLGAGTGHEHHGEMAHAPAIDHAQHEDMTAEDHAAHRGTPEIDHATHGDMSAAHHQTETSSAPIDHRAHAAVVARSDDHAGHAIEPRAMQDPHAHHGTETPAPDPHAAHAAPHAGVVSTAPTSNREIARTTPATTLREDEFDAPAPVSVSEAAKPAPSAGHDAHSMHEPKPPKEKP